jgi:V8-like Glu-specific endopeptidase
LCPALRAKHKDEFRKTTQTLKRSVGAVACLQKESDGSVGITSVDGTGFFVSKDGTFLTAGHIAHGLYPAPASRQKICEIAAIYVPKAGWKNASETQFEIELQWFKISRCAYDDDLDLAKCETVQNPFLSPDIKIKPLTVDFDTSAPAEGTPVGFTGFPLNTFQPVTGRAKVGDYGGEPNEATPKQITIDGSNWPGASGAPVYLSNGKVVGIILKRSNEESRRAFALSAAFIKKASWRY